MLLKICILGIIVSIAGIFFSGLSSHYKTLLSFAGTVLVTGYILAKLSDITQILTELSDMISISGDYIKLLLKMLGITYIAEISEAMCRDAGNNVMASQIGIFAKLSIFGISIPIIQKLITTIMDIIV